MTGSPFYEAWKKQTLEGGDWFKMPPVTGIRSKPRWLTSRMWWRIVDRVVVWGEDTIKVSLHTELDDEKHGRPL
jgi:hypothetical protein